MTREASSLQSSSVERGTYIGLLREAPQRQEQARRTGARLDRPLAPGERLTADGDRISVRQFSREA